jgi:hypothetical protein
MSERERKFRINVIADSETYARVLAVKRELEDMVIHGEIQLKAHPGTLVDWDDVIRYLMDKAERCDGKAEGRA